MSYPEGVVYDGALKRRSNAADTAANLAATAAQWVGYAVVMPVSVIRVMFFVTTAVTAGLVAPVIAVKRRPTFGSSSGAVTIASMTIPNGAAAGKVYYQDIVYGSGSSSKVLVNAGEELSLDVATQATDSGTAAGAGFITIIYDPAVDADANQSNMISKSS